MDRFDVAVVGGGITGVSAANHLAAAGFSTVLFERGDIGGATSGRTSRLQYCGLSYFSTFRSLLGALAHPRDAFESVELARRAMRNRSEFVRTTPGRVRPLTFFFPLYDDGSIPRWKVRAGFALLERLDRGGVPLDVELLPAAEARRHPMLAHLRDPGRLRGVLRYTEYQFDWPERICADVALNAEAAGAALETYSAVTAIARANGAWSVTARDALTGSERTVRAGALVNAAGAWVDALAAGSSLGVPRLNQGAKGTNVLFRLPEAFRGLGFETLTRGGEPFYVIPWDDLHYIGPFNKPHDPTPAGFLAGEDEIAGLIEEANHQFPTLRLRRADVIYSWAGVRPRTARAGAPAGGAATTLHDLHRAVPHYYVYTGGLLMTHRTAGRQVAAAVGRRSTPSGPARAPVYAPRLPLENTNSPPISPDHKHVSLAELRYAAAREHVRSLDDLMFRRVRLGWSERMGTEVAHEVAAAVRGELGWSAAQAAAAAETYVADARRTFGLKA